MPRMACSPTPHLDFARHVPGHHWRCWTLRPTPNTWIARLTHNDELVREAACQDLDAVIYLTGRWLDALVADAINPSID